jgi:hypothetical protein
MQDLDIQEVGCARRFPRIQDVALRGVGLGELKQDTYNG